jgi:hypothetical protein
MVYMPGMEQCNLGFFFAAGKEAQYFVFTDQHAYPVAAKFFNDLPDLDKIDWPLLQSRNIKHDPDEPAKIRTISGRGSDLEAHAARRAPRCMLL